MKLYDSLKSSDKFFLIAGPCVIEDRDLMITVAQKLIEMTQARGIELIYKSSYKKANRTSINSPVGPGLVEGLKLLKHIKQEYNVPIITDVHEQKDVEEVAEVADIIQIPAFLSRQTDLIIEAARTGKTVNIKKGQFMAPEDMGNVVEKVLKTGNDKIILTERGTSFGYHELVVDFRSFAIMKKFGYPVVFDVTHSMQRPSKNNTSGGTPEYAEIMAKAACATGMVDGLFIETHTNPKAALSDSASMLPINDLPGLLDASLSKNI